MNIDELEKALKTGITKGTKKPHKIFPLDGYMQLPMASRLKHKLKSKCFFCKANITDESFTAGFKTDHKNMLMHNDCFSKFYQVYLDFIESSIRNILSL